MTNSIAKKSITFAFTTLIFSCALTSAHAKYRTGFEVGIHAGPTYMYGNRTDIDVDANFQITDKASVSRWGGSFGGHLGYLHRLENSDWCVGADVGLTYTSFKKRHYDQDIDGLDINTYCLTIKNSHSFGIKFKLGKIFEEKYFLYAILGPSFRKFKYNTSFDYNLEPNSKHTDANSKYFKGICYGLGLDYALKENWRISAELTQTHYAKSSIQTNKDTENSKLNLNFKPNVLNFSIGLTYVF